MGKANLPHWARSLFCTLGGANIYAAKQPQKKCTCAFENTFPEKSPALMCLAFMEGKSHGSHPRCHQGEKSHRTLPCALHGRLTHVERIQGSLCLSSGWLWPMGAQQETGGRAGRAVGAGGGLHRRSLFHTRSFSSRLGLCGFSPTLVPPDLQTVTALLLPPDPSHTWAPVDAPYFGNKPCWDHPVGGLPVSGEDPA